MRVISMVPSWTETLIECGVDVVGRTRFCIHPHDKVSLIPSIGGTKNMDWAKLKDLNADLLILDADENPKSMSDESSLPVLHTHIQGIDDVAPALKMFAHQFANELSGERLQKLAERWQKIQLSQDLKIASLLDLPGVTEWIHLPEDRSIEIAKVYYVIWKNPWMLAAPNTFIGSVLKKLGIGQQLQLFTDRYPKVDLAALKQPGAVFLFSSEPYPFYREVETIKALQVPSAIVDGEVYSWFGLRSLLFLEKNLF